MSNGIEARMTTTTGITFTVNVAVNEVNLALAGTPYFITIPAVQYFGAGENINLKGYCLSLPYQFGQGSMPDPMWFKLGWEDGAAAAGVIPEVGVSGQIHIPDPNVWYDSDVFIKNPSPTNVKWGLQCTAISGKVSMINAPAALDTEILNAQIHLRVQHTQQITA